MVTCVICGCIKVTGSVINMALLKVVTCVICGCIKVTGSVINMALLKVVTCVICGCIKVTGSVINMALFIGGNMCNMWLYKSNRKCYKYGFVYRW